MRSDKTPEAKKARDAAFEAHRRDQLRHIASNTTPTQRIQWMEQTLLALGPQRLLQLRENRQQQLDDAYARAKSAALNRD